MNAGQHHHVIIISLIRSERISSSCVHEDRPHHAFLLHRIEHPPSVEIVYDPNIGGCCLAVVDHEQYQ